LGGDAARGCRTISPFRAALLAGFAHAVVETGRAFISYRHPDVTNVLLAALGSFTGVRVYITILSKRN